MSLSKTSFAEVVTSAKLLYEGMTNNLEELGRVGLDEALAAKLDSQKKKVEELNVRQEKLKAEIQSFKDKTILSPKLVSIQVGENAASSVYIKSQKKTAEGLGIEYELKTIDAGVTQKGLLEIIDALNRQKTVSGIIVQLPLPKQINHKAT